MSYVADPWKWLPLQLTRFPRGVFNPKTLSSSLQAFLKTLMPAMFVKYLDKPELKLWREFARSGNLPSAMIQLGTAITILCFLSWLSR